VALMMVGVVACTVTDSPPQDLVAKNDHAGLETWYMKEAAHLRKRTKDMMAMAAQDQKNPEPSTPEAVSAKIVLVPSTAKPSLQPMPRRLMRPS
jgi:hypothetical protein